MGNDYYIFLPTPSARRATRGAGCNSYVRLISTHALREEGDYIRRFEGIV